MNMTQPIKDIEKLKVFKEYYEYREPNIRKHPYAGYHDF